MFYMNLFQTKPINFLPVPRYHMGSVAFGSLVLAIIRLFRILIEYIHRKCQKYPNNALVKALTW